MDKKYSPTNEEIARDYRLWREYHDVDGHVSEKNFNRRTVNGKIRELEKCHGKDDVNETT